MTVCTDGWNAMGGAKNPFFLLSIPKNYKKVNALCNVQMATRALEVVWYESELLYIHGHPWTTIISTGTPHLIYLGPICMVVRHERFHSFNAPNMPTHHRHVRVLVCTSSIQWELSNHPVPVQ